MSAPDGFAVILVLDGSGRLAGADGEVNFQSRDVFAVPAAFGPWVVQGTGRLLVAALGVGWPRSLAQDRISYEKLRILDIERHVMVSVRNRSAGPLRSGHSVVGQRER